MLKKVLFLIACVFTLQGYELSICSIFQNEARYLQEWIEFHKIQGVEHFYLYNHNSTDNYLEVLQPYIESNWVTLVEWPYLYEQGNKDAWLHIQKNAYLDCIRSHQNESTWMAIIDLDEFLFCPDGTKLPVFLRPYLKYAALCVNWLIFGTSGVEDILPGQTMIETLTHCGPKEDIRHLQGKQILQTKFVLGCEDVHSFRFQKGKFSVNVWKKKTNGAHNLSPISLDKIRINHYWTRTEKWFREKKIPSREQRRWHETPDSLRQRAAPYNEYVDAAILPFVPLLRKNMSFSP